MNTARALGTSCDHWGTDRMNFMEDARSTLSTPILDRIESAVREQYRSFSSGLPFHGWHHVEFVRSKAVALAHKNGSDVAIVEVAALLHDLNYMVQRNSRVNAARHMRRQLLNELDIDECIIERIEQVISEAETEARDEHASLEAQALSDADTLFKALPITPVLLAHRYMEETGQDLRQLCDRILRDQVPLRDKGIYFYDRETSVQYEEWANANLHLWQCIDVSLKTAEVQGLVSIIESDFSSTGSLVLANVPESPDILEE
jgi:uncharacterized protein